MSPVMVLGWMVVGWFVLLSAVLFGSVAHSVAQAWRTRPASKLAQQNTLLVRSNRDLTAERDYYRGLLERELRKSSL